MHRDLQRINKSFLEYKTSSKRSNESQIADVKIYIDVRLLCRTYVHLSCNLLSRKLRKESEVQINFYTSGDLTPVGFFIYY